MSRSATIDRIRSQVPVIAPSMLKCDFGNLHRDIEQLNSAGAAVLHWDVMDGHFVPNLSYGAMVIDRTRDMTKAIFDAHLMISNPAKYIDEYIKAGCEAITFHLEAVPAPSDLLRYLRDKDIVAGLAINPGTPVQKLEPFLNECDLVLVMSVEPGFGGQKFMPSALEKLRQLRSQAPSELILSVDGGVGHSTVADCAAAGADLFVVGSAIFDQPNFEVAVKELTQLGTRRTGA